MKKLDTMADATLGLRFTVSADGSEATGAIAGRLFMIQQPRKNQFALSTDGYQPLHFNNPKQLNTVLRLYDDRA